MRPRGYRGGQSAETMRPPPMNVPSVARRDSPSVPVPVLEALASAWEDHADKLCYAPGDDDANASQAFAMTECARMLREAITKGSAG